MTISAFKNYMCFDLEMGPDFEEYNSEWLHLRVCVWEPDQIYDFTKQESFPTYVVRTSLTEKLSDLEKTISEVTGIDSKRVVILLRHEQVNGTIRCEFFNMDWRQGKLLKECSKFEHGWTLFVEDADPKQPFDSFQWKKEFNAELERVTLLINDPRNDPDALHYSVRVSTQKSTTIAELKLKISGEFDLPTDSFFLVKAGTDKDLKEMQRTVD